MDSIFIFRIFRRSMLEVSTLSKIRFLLLFLTTFRGFKLNLGLIGFAMFESCRLKNPFIRWISDRLDDNIAKVEFCIDIWRVSFILRLTF